MAQLFHKRQDSKIVINQEKYNDETECVDSVSKLCLIAFLRSFLIIKALDHVIHSSVIIVYFVMI